MRATLKPTKNSSNDPEYDLKLLTDTQVPGRNEIEMATLAKLEIKICEISNCNSAATFKLEGNASGETHEEMQICDYHIDNAFEMVQIK